MNTVYFILGMHRSGTSALGGVLNALGLDVGSYLMPANETNPKGYFENRFIYWHNEKILNENDSKWSDSQFDISSIPKKKYKSYVDESIEILNKEFQHSQNFLIKDPRICILFPIWEDACKILNIDIKILIPYRNPLEVANSLKSRNDFSIEQSLVLWSKHFFQAEYYSRPYQRIFLSFDYLIDDTENYIKDLEKFTELDTSTSSKEKINNFIDKDFKHINISIKKINSNYPSFMRETFELLEKSDFSDLQKIDTLRHEFNGILNFFNAQIQVLQSKIGDEKKLNTQLQEKLIKHDETLGFLATEQEKNKEHIQSIKRIESQLKSHLNTEIEMHDEIKNLKNQLEIEQQQNKDIQLLVNQFDIEFQNNREIKLIKFQLSSEQEKSKKLNELLQNQENKIENLLAITSKVRSNNKKLTDHNALQNIKISHIHNHNNLLKNKISSVKSKAKGLISDSRQKITNLEKTNNDKNEQISTLRNSLTRNQTYITDLKNNQINIQQNLIKAKSNITSSMADFISSCKSSHNKHMKFKDDAANNIKQFHTLFTLHIGSKVAERVALNDKITKIKSNPISYLNPLRLKNIFERLNNLNEKIDSLESKFNEVPWKVIESFNSSEYLENNDDVNQAILDGQFINALEHFILFGYLEVQAGARIFNNNDTYVEKRLSRSQKEKEFRFNGFLSGLHHSFDLFQNNEIDSLLDFELPNVIDNITYSPVNHLGKDVSINQLDSADNSKPKKPSSKMVKWLEVRGIELIVLKQGLNGFNQYLAKLHDSSLDKTQNNEALICLNTDQFNISKYVNHALSDKKLIIFTENKESYDLSILMNSYSYVLLCQGVIINKDLIQKIQPHEIMCVFEKNDFPIEDNKLSIPKSLEQDFLLNKLLKSSKERAIVIKPEKTINLTEVKIVKPQKKFKSNVEYISAAGISGWIFNIESTSQHSIVELLLVINEKDCISVKNTIHREDVNRSHNIQCLSGFQINVPTKYLDGNKHKFNLYAKYENSFQLIRSFDFCETSPWICHQYNNSKTVLFCSHNMRSQGAQNSLFELAIGLKRLYGITPIVQSPADGPLSTKYKEHGIQVIIDNSLHKLQDDADEWSTQVEIFSQKLKTLNCQVLIANTLQTFSMIHAAKMANISSIWIPRESEPPRSYFDYLSSPLNTIAQLTFTIATQVIFVADATRKIWSFMDKNNAFKVIHNSLNTSLLNQDSINSRYEIRKTFGIKEDEVVLLSLGTVSSRKGQLDFVKALPNILSQAKNPTKAIIVGMGSNPLNKTDEYSNFVKKTVEGYAKDIRDKIILIPETDKLVNTKTYDFYSMADVFVFTSRIESFPRVILEAMYFSLPIVTTPCFGVIEQCIENYNAFYYDEEDTQQLETLLLELVNNEQTRQSFSKGSNKLFKNMQTYDQMLINYHNVIDNLIPQEKQ